MHGSVSFSDAGHPVSPVRLSSKEELDQGGGAAERIRSRAPGCKPGLVLLSGAGVYLAARTQH